MAVQERSTSRYLLFDSRGRLCGRRAGTDVDAEYTVPCPEAKALAFSGIHVLSPRLLLNLHEEGAFSIVAAYMRLAKEGETIEAFRADEYQWQDLGRPEHVREAEREMEAGKYLYPAGSGG